VAGGCVSADEEDWARPITGSLQFNATFGSLGDMCSTTIGARGARVLPGTKVYSHIHASMLGHRTAAQILDRHDIHPDRLFLVLYEIRECGRPYLEVRSARRAFYSSTDKHPAARLGSRLHYSGH
jgi:hypothetical protein